MIVKAITQISFGALLIGLAVLWTIYILPEQAQSTEPVLTGHGFRTEMQWGIYYISALTIAGTITFIFGITNLFKTKKK